MKSAIRSLLLTLFIVLICLFLGWVYLRNQGYEKVHAPFQHPFFSENESRILVAYRGASDQFPPNTEIALTEAARLDPRIVLWVDVRPTMDRELVLFSGKDLSVSTDGEGWTRYKTFAQLKELDAGYHYKDAAGATVFRGKGISIPRLADVLVRFPDRRFVVNFAEYTPGLADKIIAVIEEAKASDRILVQSEVEGLLKDMREKRPMWLYGTSPAQITQLQFMTGIGLQAAAPIRGDVVTTPYSYGKRVLAGPEMIDEAHRRKKKILVGPVAETDVALDLVAKGADGVITSKPAELLPLLKR